MYIFIRHAETNVDPSNAVNQWKLTDKGMEQAKRLPTVLKHNDIKPGAIYSSEESKSVETVKYISRHFDLKIEQKPEFNELHLTEYVESEQKFLEIRQKQLNNPDFSFQRGETSREALHRFQEGLTSIEPSEDPIICSHGTVLTLYLANRYDFDKNEVYSFWKKLGFGTIVLAEPDGYEIIKLDRDQN